MHVNIKRKTYKEDDAKFDLIIDADTDETPKTIKKDLSKEEEAEPQPELPKVTPAADEQPQPTQAVKPLPYQKFDVN